VHRIPSPRTYDKHKKVQCLPLQFPSCPKYEIATLPAGKSAADVRISCHSHKHPVFECVLNILPKLHDQTSFDHNLKLGRSTLFRSMSSNAPFTRLDWISHDRFDLQGHRHTGAWFCLYRGLSLAEALKTIEDDGHPHPV